MFFIECKYNRSIVKGKTLGLLTDCEGDHLRESFSYTVKTFISKCFSSCETSSTPAKNVNEIHVTKGQIWQYVFHLVSPAFKFLKPVTS